jgi:2-phosphosulfolactate phosphatase
VNGALTSVDVAWGPSGLRALARRCETVVIVDVLRFTTAVDVAVGRGAVVYPYRWHDGTEDEYAQQLGAELAVKDGEVGEDADGVRWTLSPARLSAIPPQTKLVLPSPNGAALAFGAHEAGARRVVAGCLRNAPAVGAWVASAGGRVGVLAAGERWNGATGPLRPAVEDWLGAGAIARVADTDEACSTPDAVAAAASFVAVSHRLPSMLRDCMSGRQLRERGLHDDVEMAAQHSVSDCVPTLDGDRFVDGSGAADRMGE